MEALIDDLLVLAREGSDIAETETIDVTELVEKCWSFVPTEQATFEVESDIFITGDWSRIQQLFENVFRNAIEHGGDTVTVQVSTLDTGAGLYIEDDGPDLPEGASEQIFDDGFSTGEKGTGFGLSIVEQVVEAHGWEITATEGNHKGARFEITNIEFVDQNHPA